MMTKLLCVSYSNANLAFAFLRQGLLYVGYVFEMNKHNYCIRQGKKVRGTVVLSPEYRT